MPASFFVQINDLIINGFTRLDIEKLNKGHFLLSVHYSGSSSHLIGHFYLRKYENLIALLSLNNFMDFSYKRLFPCIPFLSSVIIIISCIGRVQGGLPIE